MEDLTYDFQRMSYKSGKRGCGCGIGCGCGCCGGGPFAKCCLILFNTIFLVGGVALTAFGIWAKAEDNFVSLQNLVDYGTGENTLSNVSSVLIGFGVFAAIVSAFGCLAVCCAQKKCLICSYGLLLCVIFCCGIAAAIAYGVFKGKIDDELSGALDKTIHDYESRNDLATDWDYVQTWMKCCGSTGPKDYTNVTLRDKDLHVPVTCCVLTNNDPEHPKPNNGTSCQQDAYKYQIGNISTSQSLETTGCYDSLGNYISSKLLIIICAGVGLSTLQVLGICLAIGICLGESNKYEAFY